MSFVSITKKIIGLQKGFAPAQLFARSAENWFKCIGYDYMAYMDYMDLDVICQRKAIEPNHSLTAENWWGYKM